MEWIGRGIIGEGKTFWCREDRQRDGWLQLAKSGCIAGDRKSRCDGKCWRITGWVNRVQEAGCCGPSA